MKDIAEMHRKYGVNEAVEKFSAEKLQKFLEFRINFIEEELNELKESDNPEDAVDALIDICVVAIGTLNAFQVNSKTAWDEVLRANMEKVVGVKDSRPNPLGLPDLIKPEGWVGPDHTDNYGLFTKAYSKKTQDNTNYEFAFEDETVIIDAND